MAGKRKRRRGREGAGGDGGGGTGVRCRWSERHSAVVYTLTK